MCQGEFYHLALWTGLFNHKATFGSTEYDTQNSDTSVT